MNDFIHGSFFTIFSFFLWINKFANMCYFFSCLLLQNGLLKKWGNVDVPTTASTLLNFKVSMKITLMLHQFKEYFEWLCKEFHCFEKIEPIINLRHLKIKNGIIRKNGRPKIEYVELSISILKKAIRRRSSQLLWFHTQKCESPSSFVQRKREKKTIGRK